MLGRATTPEEQAFLDGGGFCRLTKAIRIHANGGPEVMRWEEHELPPPAAGEARVRHTAIGINYSDVNVRRGGFYLARPLRFPLILGNEAAGVVESVGPGVIDVGPGDRVVYAGHARRVLRGDRRLCASPQCSGRPADQASGRHVRPAAPPP